jgi:hypothetical protein
MNLRGIIHKRNFYLPFALSPLPHSALSQFHSQFTFIYLFSLSHFRKYSFLSTSPPPPPPPPTLSKIKVKVLN